MGKEDPSQTGQADANAQLQIWQQLLQQQQGYNNTEQQQQRGAAGDLLAGDSGYATAGESRPAMTGTDAAPPGAEVTDQNKWSSTAPVAAQQAGTAPSKTEASATGATMPSTQPAPGAPAAQPPGKQATPTESTAAHLKDLIAKALSPKQNATPPVQAGATPNPNMQAQPTTPKPRQGVMGGTAAGMFNPKAPQPL